MVVFKHVAYILLTSAVVLAVIFVLDQYGIRVCPQPASFTHSMLR